MKRYLTLVAVLGMVFAAAVAFVERRRPWKELMWKSFLQGLLSALVICSKRLWPVGLSLAVWKLVTLSIDRLKIQNRPALSVVAGSLIGLAATVVWGFAAEVLGVFLALALGDLWQEVREQKALLADPKEEEVIVLAPADEITF